MRCIEHLSAPSLPPALSLRELRSGLNKRCGATARHWYRQSVYRFTRRAGDGNHQQMTVAVPNVDQMGDTGRQAGRGGGTRGEEQQRKGPR